MDKDNKLKNNKLLLDFFNNIELNVQNVQEQVKSLKNNVTFVMEIE